MGGMGEPESHTPEKKTRYSFTESTREHNKAWLREKAGGWVEERVYMHTNTLQRERDTERERDREREREEREREREREMKLIEEKDDVA